MQLVIDLPPREEQIAFNRERWAEVLDDESLARYEGRVETDAFGNVVMMPPASGSRSYRTSRIGRRSVLIFRLGSSDLLRFNRVESVT